MSKVRERKVPVQSTKKKVPEKEPVKKAVGDEIPATLKDLVRPHVDSFNFLLEGGLSLAVQNLIPQLIDANPKLKTPSMRFWIEDAHIGTPMRTDVGSDTRLFPSECREYETTYGARLVVTIARQVGQGPIETMTKNLGDIPIMVMSSACHLSSLSPKELIGRKEEAHELGGYFILNGLERLIRLLVVNRRNHVFGIVRPSWLNKNKYQTQYGCIIRCVRKDQSSQSVTLHYLSTGSCVVRFVYQKKEYYIPAVLLLRALKETTDREIFDQVTAGTKDSFITDRVELMLRDSKNLGVNTQAEALGYIGSRFRIVRRSEDSESDVKIAEDLIKENVFVHCEQESDLVRNQHKFDILIYMIQKLYALASERIKPENIDAVSSHEILLPGHLYLMILKERLQDWLGGIKTSIKIDMRLRPERVDLTTDTYFKSVADAQPDIPQKMCYFLSTGNLRSNTGLDLMQVSGFTIVAEKLNYLRYIAHFRSVHRGQFFTTMKTTTVRKLLPESWGFMCPVHTPDGSPCGLLNHLAALCQVLTHPIKFDQDALVKVFVELGMHPIKGGVVLPHHWIPVVIDGIVMGKVPEALAESFAKQLRLLKAKGHPDVPAKMEIFTVMDDLDGLYPTISIGTQPARMIRPVYMLATKNHPQYLEWISPMEQLNMEIACTPEDFRAGETTHIEVAPTAMLSAVASLTPFSDYNQSPRNMYQCQMGKQTMGVPFHSLPYRTDNKAYRLQTPQKPLVQNEGNLRFHVDDYPLGTNAVVAVISYTGYDMEDAMILNKSAYERGMAHASLYKYEPIDLVKEEGKKHASSNPRYIFSAVDPKNLRNQEALQNKLTPDGFPKVGEPLTAGDPVYCYMDRVLNKLKPKYYKDMENSVVEMVRVVGPQKSKQVQQIGIMKRYNRNPVIGDKFASRHGQKGVLSQLWPQVDMPFTESGMTPDIIINPHAFPSRMTIGMLIESLAGKSGALHGVFQESTPFQFNEQNRADKYFGEQLVKAGYNYLGTEPLYSGTTGTELVAEIYIGVVYYQRLRHMVSDKSQVRSTGPVNRIHRQPVKGRKVGGGIRFGEMERDSLLAHGVSYMLNDRLMKCSDYHTQQVCTKCGNVLSTTVIPSKAKKRGITENSNIYCRICNSSAHCSPIALPFVFVYLVNEMAAMNIRLTLDVRVPGALEEDDSGSVAEQAGGNRSDED